MIGSDFNLPLNFGQNTFINLSKGLANEYRTDGFLTTGKFSSQKALRQMRSKIQWHSFRGSGQDSSAP